MRCVSHKGLLMLLLLHGIPNWWLRINCMLLVGSRHAVRLLLHGLRYAIHHNRAHRWHAHLHLLQLPLLLLLLSQCCLRV